MVSWAKAAAPAYVKVKESINWAELKKLTVVNGETVAAGRYGRGYSRARWRKNGLTYSRSRNEQHEVTLKR